MLVERKKYIILKGWMWANNKAKRMEEGGMDPHRTFMGFMIVNEKVVQTISDSANICSKMI
jgi:hypothetical protein